MSEEIADLVPMTISKRDEALTAILKAVRSALAEGCTETAIQAAVNQALAYPEP